jgi:glycolate oxidase iron-sulfur subunit
MKRETETQASGRLGPGRPHESITRILPEIERCLKCGLCRSVCPVFAEALDESASARGRIAMVEALYEDGLTLTPLLADRLSKCLNCKACMEACPSAIKVDEIVLAARAEIFTRGRFPALKKFIFRHLLRRGRLLPPVSKSLAFIERKILRGLPQSSPYRVLLPLVRMDRQRTLPLFAEQTLMDRFGEIVTPRGEIRMRVGLFVGCATNLIYPELGESVLRVLVGEGMEVVLPHDQGCCGMPVYTAGDVKTAGELAGANLRAFGKHKVDAIVTACASCGTALKQDYKKILGIEPAGLGAPIYDFGEFLAKYSRLKFNEPRGGTVKATYHYPCHLTRGQGVKDAPGLVLEALPHVDYVEMNEADRCCGGAGTFSLTHYDLAKKIGRRKVGNIAASGAEIVATSCPSCMMQLEDMLRRNGLPQRVVHLADLVASCYPALEESAGLIARRKR